MLAVIGRPELAEDPRFSTPLARRENADELDQLMADWIGSQPLGKVLADFSEAQAPIAPVYDIAQIVADPHYNARQTIIQVDDDDLGEISMQNVVPRLSETPGRVRHTGRTAIGADMEAIRDWLGTDAEVPSPRPADSSEDQGAPGI
jgi:crotonobetainyl-CoA:carnitine CoA-transferase CaiB-like acyl-CoA transferase